MTLVAEMTWPQMLLGLVLIVICLILMAVILLQRGRGMGLSGAFGGGGGSSAFGAKTGDVFTWITVGVTGAFLFLVIIGNFVFDMSVQAKPRVVETPPVSPTAPTPIDLPPMPSGGGADGGSGNEPGSKKFPIKLEQVPVDPNDPSKGTTFRAVPVEGAPGSPPGSAVPKVIPTPSGASQPSGAAPMPGATPPVAQPKSAPAPSGESKSAEPAKPDAEKPKQPEDGK